MYLSISDSSVVSDQTSCLLVSPKSLLDSVRFTIVMLATPSEDKDNQVLKAQVHRASSCRI